MHTSSLKIGLFAIGLDTYWPQFDGLKGRLEGYLKTVKEKIAAIHPHIINAGLVDSTDKAFAAGRQFKTEDVDIIFFICYHLCFVIHRITRSAAGQSTGDHFKSLPGSSH
jgi:L-arabinose isomerase